MLDSISKAEWRAIRQANKMFNADEIEVMEYNSVEERRNRREAISNCADEKETTELS